MKTFFVVFWGISASIFLMFLIGCFHGYFYPLKYEDEIAFYSLEYDINPTLVASVINVESGFNKDRVSSKGAMGLMQLMPKTAQWVATKLGESFEKDDLFDPKINIKYGAYYLSYLINYFSDENLAICAYNAGMGNVNEWLGSENFYVNRKISTIPFKETQNYYNKVLKNKRYYKNKFQKIDNSL